jgi:hypothetical protein
MAGSVATAFMATFIEPFFSAFLVRIGVDSSTWVSPLMTWVSKLASQEWFRLLGIGTICFAIGLWTDWFLAKAVKKSKDEAEQIKPDWRVAYLRRTHLKVWEAACLIAGEMPRRPLPQGAASAYAEQIKHGLVDAQIVGEWNFTRNLILSSISSSNATRDIIIRNFRRDNVSNDTVVDMKSLIKYFKDRDDGDAIRALNIF